MRKQVSIFSVLMVCICVASIQAAFIVEPHSTGLASDHFSGSSPHFTAPSSSALGLQGDYHAWGSYDAFPDVYQYSYAPGTDDDNFDVPLDNRYFGNGQYSTNLAGGQTGYYNVYITWPSSANVAALCTLTITHDGQDIVWTDINMNDNGTVAFAQDPMWGPFPDGTVFYGGNNRWLQIADEVLLTAGNTYTVTQAAQADAYVSMRSAGVMWEFVAVPEPATLLMLGVGGLVLRRRK